MTTLTLEKSFDLSRAVLEDYLDAKMYPPRLMVEAAMPLQQAVDVGHLMLDTRLLTFTVDEQLFALPMSVVLAYNVIQHDANDQRWMMTFCNACNTGMVFNPTMDGQNLHFRRRGAYDGLLLIYDEETSSYWQHITGEGLHGSSAGKQLSSLADTKQMTVAEALTHPSPFVFLHELTPEQAKLAMFSEKMRANPERVGDVIAMSIGTEDTRRPRFELGLGVWDERGSMFFPLTAMHMNNNVLMTQFHGRQLLVYQHPEAIAPTAVYVETKEAYWAGDVLHLDQGATIRDGVYQPIEGVMPLERPTQLLMRWYGFALTFPGCRVFGE
jgi:predicted heme/steroid binding protein